MKRISAIAFAVGIAALALTTLSGERIAQAEQPSPKVSEEVEALQQRLRALLDAADDLRQQLKEFEQPSVRSGAQVEEALRRGSLEASLVTADDLSADAVFGSDRIECPGKRLEKPSLFVVCYDTKKRIPIWVGYELDAKNLEGDAKRTDNFRLDPDVSEHEQATLADYYGSNFDRGHMAPAGAFKRSRSAMETTFYMTNMAPQTPHLNRQVWRILEQNVRSLASAPGVSKVWVFTGTLNMTSDGKPQSSGLRFLEPSDGELRGRVVVPSHTYKAILVLRKNNTLDAVGVSIPNKTSKLGRNPNDYIVAIRSIETALGQNIDFFSVLPDWIENALEGSKRPWPLEPADQEQLFSLDPASPYVIAANACRRELVGHVVRETPGKTPREIQIVNNIRYVHPTEKLLNHKVAGRYVDGSDQSRIFKCVWEVDLNTGQLKAMKHWTGDALDAS